MAALLTEHLERAVIAAPFGALTLEAKGDVLLEVGVAPTPIQVLDPATPLLQEAARQFSAYFNDPAYAFSLPLLTSTGSAYQQTVWQALCAIPRGSVKSYGRIAEELRSGPRAVAAACRANRFSILIPCHRAVASHGLGGYCGSADGDYLNIKRWLLRHEGYDCS